MTSFSRYKFQVGDRVVFWYERAQDGQWGHLQGRIGTLITVGSDAGTVQWDGDDDDPPILRRMSVSFYALRLLADLPVTPEKIEEYLRG